MKPSHNILLLLILMSFKAVCSNGSSVKLETDPRVIVRSIISVSEGDTFRAYLSDRSEEEQIRVSGVDMPKIIQGKCYSEKAAAIEARDFVREYLANAKKIELDDLRRDKYQPLLAIVYVDEANLADVLVNKGLGRRWQGQPENWCN